MVMALVLVLGGCDLYLSRRLNCGPVLSTPVVMHDAGEDWEQTSRSDDHSTALAFTGLSRVASRLVRISVPPGAVDFLIK